MGWQASLGSFFSFFLDFLFFSPSHIWHCVQVRSLGTAGKPRWVECTSGSCLCSGKRTLSIGREHILQEENTWNVRRVLAFALVREHFFRKRTHSPGREESQNTIYRNRTLCLGREHILQEENTLSVRPVLTFVLLRGLSLSLSPSLSLSLSLSLHTTLFTADKYVTQGAPINSLSLSLHQ